MKVAALFIFCAGDGLRDKTWACSQGCANGLASGAQSSGTGISRSFFAAASFTSTHPLCKFGRGHNNCFRTCAPLYPDSAISGVLPPSCTQDDDVLHRQLHCRGGRILGGEDCQRVRSCRLACSFDFGKLPCALATNVLAHSRSAVPGGHTGCQFCNLEAKELNPSCRQFIRDNHEWVNSWASRRKGPPHVFGDMLKQVDFDPEAIAGRTFREKNAAIQNAPFVEQQYCFTHGMDCSCLVRSDLDFSGLPCQDNSRANFRRQFQEGRFNTCFMVWAKKHKALETPLLILENTPVT